ncbi:MAG: biotin carboxylase N-terminal domain-containing protein [Patescibacteria group bacterium]
MVETEKLLVLNRGDPARRVIHTARKLEIPTATVFTPDDEKSLHVKDANEAHKIESYSDIAGAVKIARRIGAKMIHPGWGFESENPKFPRACDKAGIIFIGPSEEAMKKAGDKKRAKNIAKKLEIPVIKSSLRKTPAGITKWATKNGLSDGEESFPMMIKAARGGGGLANTAVFHLEDINAAIERLTDRSGKHFGNSTIFIEQYIPNARHVEVQLLGDQHGNLVYQGTRDCTIQYRNQKVIEVAPASFLTLNQEKLLQDYALAIGKAIEYSSAGTAEFLITPDGEIFFMEFNPRLQVEHGITELITGDDLVEEQIRIAQGEHLVFSQEDIKFNGVAIEARVNAQTINPTDPKTLMASSGVVEQVIFPKGKDIRVDHSLYDGYELNLNYNPTQAKVMAWSPSREEAIQKLREALGCFEVKGVKTNIPLLLIVLSHPRFLAGTHTTTFFEEMLEEMVKAGAIGGAVAFALQERQREEEVVVFPKTYDPWRQAGRMEQMSRGSNLRKGWR